MQVDLNKCWTEGERRVEEYEKWEWEANKCSRGASL